MHRFSRRNRAANRRASWLGLTLLAGCIGVSAGAGGRLLTQPQPRAAVPLMALDAPRHDTSATALHQIVDAPAPARSSVADAAPVQPGIEAVAPAPSPAKVVIDDHRPQFDGRTLVAKRTIRMLVTAYSPDERSCGIHADGITASGKSVWTNGMKLVAADTRLLPFGTVIAVPGYNGGQPVQVLDRGGKIKGHRLDVLYPTHEIARQWGKRYLDVTVYEYADE